MLKSRMEFVDVVFPLNLGPLTYKCPEHLRERAVPGMLVSAPLKNKTINGIISGKSSPSALCPMSSIRYISDIHGESPLLSPPLLKLLTWMSDYYIANMGIVLKNMLPAEAFKKVKARKKQHLEFSVRRSEQSLEQLQEVDEEALVKINESVSKKEYKTFLLHAPTSLYEISFLTKILQSHKGVIILVPEIVYVNHTAPLIREIAGERLCILHSGLSRGERSDTCGKIFSGQCSIVLGTRTALFAPLKNVSLIVVMQEHSSSYKPEEALRYNGRDIAVMRGYLEKATVVLSSICPSIESIYNAKRNKYILMRPDVVIRRPTIKIVDMHCEKQISPNLSKTVVDAAMSSIRKNERIMFVINRKGYSMLTCSECDYTETCDKCGIPLVFHKDDKSLRCHYCGFKSLPPDKCKRCGSFNVKLMGAGIQRIEEDIKRYLNIEPVRLDSDRIKRKIKPDELSEIIKEGNMVLGTKLLTGRLHGAGEFGMAAVLNADIYLNLPDFRSIEKAYQEISVIADKIKPGGRLYIQTRMPGNYLFSFVKNNDYYAFCEDELSRRKAVVYPPYSKLAIITFTGMDYDENKIRDTVKRLLANDEGLEILGPSSFSRRGKTEHIILLKSASKSRLHSSVKEFLSLFEGHKNLKVGIAIDP